jgi:hypothetical protein
LNMAQNSLYLHEEEPIYLNCTAIREHARYFDWDPDQAQAFT